LKNFSTVLKILEKLDERTKGLHFELYCKWFLENDPCYSMQLKKVWLWNDWPDNWGRDNGINLVAETNHGEFWAIQAKAYSGNYYVTKTDVDKFLSESARKKISYRLLISTTNNIGKKARKVMLEQEKKVGICTLDDLENTLLDWPLSIKELKPSVRKKLYTPRDHQKRALKDVIEGFGNSWYGQLYMACGTGKTLIGLWLFEKLKCQNALVLVPSISLVSQIYREWSANSRNTFNPIFVCSDPTVREKDQIISDTSELGFPSTTNSDDIIKYIHSTSTPKVVFSTYHSSPVIAEVCKKDSSVIFDLTIADEAHRCTGSTSSDFTTIVDKSAIKTKRKLFMTATPKIFSDHVKRKAEELDCEIFSMSDEDVFGPVFYRLSFSQAIKENLLSDYQILISVMDNETYREYAEKGRFVLFDNNETDARTLASQLLVAKAIRKHKLRRVISFHNRKTTAERFIDTFSSALTLLSENNRPKISFFESIFGSMQQRQRNNVMRQFKNLQEETTGLLGNVRCLSEGVDVPTLDGVAFIDPKGSEIDITQAVGRAIRKSPEKKIGTIIIPVFVDSDTCEEVDLEKSCFKTVYKVLKALRAHDDVLAEELDNFRLELGKRKFRKKPKLSKVIVDIPAKIGKKFSDALQIKIIENCSSSWHFYFGLLEEYARKHGHLRLTAKHVEDGYKLGVWISTQRTQFKKKVLEKWKIEKLDSIGFSWDRSEDDWKEQYNYLKKFREVFPDRWPKDKEHWPPDNPLNLGVWCGTQRQDYKKNKLGKDKIELLDNINFPWDILKYEWYKQLNYLKEFRRIYPDRWPKRNEYFPENNNLGSWFSKQKYKQRKGKLEDWKIAELRKMEVSFNPVGMWEEKYQQVCDFREQNPNKWPKRPGPLGNWLLHQRSQFNKGKLSQERISKLKRLGFDFSGIFDSKWLLKYKYLKEEYRKHNPNKWPSTKDIDPKDKRLAVWCQKQRRKFKKGELASWKIKMLDDIDFPWEKRVKSVKKDRVEKWLLMYDVLALFRIKNPNRWPRAKEKFGENSPFVLGVWCDTQKRLYNEKKLEPWKEKKLTALGFDFENKFVKAWSTQFNHLEEFRKIYPERWPTPKEQFPAGNCLGSWVSTQRIKFSKSKLEDWKQKKLDAISFQWVSKKNRKNKLKKSKKYGL